jgi:hypothetical protein
VQPFLQLPVRGPGLSRVKVPRVSDYFNRVDVGDGTSLLFSGSTLCVDRVPTAWARRLAAGADPSFLPLPDREHLLKRGHLTRLSPRHEREAFRRQVRRLLSWERRCSRSRQRATLSFILTYDCNLACRYCYQRSLDRRSCRAASPSSVTWTLPIRPGPTRSAMAATVVALVATETRIACFRA